MLLFISWYLLIVVLCLVGRAAFYWIHLPLIQAAGETGFFAMLWHGLPLDIAVAGYASAVPALILLISVWWNGKALRRIWRCYEVVAMTGLVCDFVANIALYSYWGFPLDSTPLFFLLSSPGEVLACLTIGQMILGPIAIIALIAGLSYLVDRILRPERVLGKQTKRSVGRSAGITLAYLLVMALMFLGIRGGFTVATNNIGRVYFSQNIRLNHATVNPLFSFVDSVIADEDLTHKYRFMDRKKADGLFSEMSYTALRTTPDSILTPVFEQALQEGKTGKGKGVHVIVVVLESFSRQIMGDGVVRGVTPHLDHYAQEGVYLTRFYANSFRTDRGLLTILSGFPAQPTMSLMKHPHKTNGLYSIAGSLRKEGFQTRFVYGGDANFTNCRSYLMATGFEDIVAEEDFDSDIPRSKWGVDDRALFQRALEETNKDPRDRNVFRVIQTSSSHEPFQVPWDRFEDKALNAFSFTDDCLGQFLTALQQGPDWNRTLVVLVPDHQGCYPRGMSNASLERFQIPLILTGGAIAHAEQIPTLGSQQDIAATLLALLHVDHQEFTYSKDLLDPYCPHFAFFAMPDEMGLVTEENALIYDNKSGQILLDEGSQKGQNLQPAQAYLQKMYDDIASR